MALLKASEWYDIARTTNWTPKFVSEEELFPEEMSDVFRLSLEQWEAYDEPFKVTYRDYVKVQSKKDIEAYTVRSALARSNYMDKAEPGWQSILKLHFGAVCLVEYAAMIGEAKMARFGKAPGMRNMATFGLMDEMRHTQIQLYFAHAFVGKSRQFDSAMKAMHTNSWAAVATRQATDDTILGRDAVSMAIMLTFAVEQGFTNLQFLGLAADAAKLGDYSFSNLIASVQTDEARHAQIGGAALKVLIANGKKELAQQLVDISFWRQWRLFFTITGPSIDYLTPLAHREKSFKEFVHEFIIVQFDRTLRDLGLDRPWYWNKFIESIEYYSHSGHLEIWFVRETIWWDPAAGVTAAEREWLEEKYPEWNARWGRIWDVIKDNVVNGREDKLTPQTLPMLCNTCGLSAGSTPHEGHQSKGYWTDLDGRRYYFCSEPCQWIFNTAPDRYKDHLSVIDRFTSGVIQPQTIDGILGYFDIQPGERGKDAQGYAWAWEDEAKRLQGKVA